MQGAYDIYGPCFDKSVRKLSVKIQHSMFCSVSRDIIHGDRKVVRNSGSPLFCGPI